MPSKLALGVLSALAPVAALLAQNVTVPAVMGGVEGGSATNVPFGSNLACRYQCIYDAGTLPWAGPRLITGLRLRADNGTPLAPGAAINGKGYLVVSVLMSTTASSAVSASDAFLENRGVDQQWVLQQHHLQLPAQPVTSAPGPRAADIDLPFTTPWWYGLVPARGNVPAPANLLVEIWILSQPAGAYPVDNIGGCVAPTTDFGSQGVACAVPGQSPPVLRTDVSMTGGSYFSWHVDHGPPSAPLVLALAMTDQGFLFGNPAWTVPYPMFDPADPSRPSPALAALAWPAPDCWINLDIDLGTAVTLFATCDAAGNASVRTQVPPGSQFVGTEFFGQAFLYAQTANPLQVIATRGHSSTICGPIDVARIFAFYNGQGTPAPPPPPTGSVQYGMGLILEVQ